MSSHSISSLMDTSLACDDDWLAEIPGAKRSHDNASKAPSKKKSKSKKKHKKKSKR